MRRLILLRFTPTNSGVPSSTLLDSQRNRLQLNPTRAFRPSLRSVLRAVLPLCTKLTQTISRCQAYHSIIYPFEAVLRHQQQQREQAAQAAQQNAAGAPPPPPLAPAFPSPLPLPPPPALPAFAPQDSPRQLPQALNDRSASRTGFYGQSSGGAAGGGANFAGVQQSPNQTMGLSGQQGMGMGMPIGVGDGGSQNRSGTPAMATLLEDRKGKGKAKEMDRRKGPIGRKVGQGMFVVDG
jgi:hypothetical protein